MNPEPPGQAAQPNRATDTSKLPPKLQPGLYVVATPIGNLGDITLRALEVLKGCDQIACEDKNASAKLLSRYGVRVPLIAYHEHTTQKARTEIVARLAAGARIALISDAGTPLISDPGYRLVREAIAAGLSVTGLPGPSAPLLALTLSGLPCDRFLFAGFLPPRAAARRAALGQLAPLEASLIFLESPRRLPQALADMAQMLGNRHAAVARELTKLFEEVRRAPLFELRDHYAQAGPPKGEVVVVVAPPAAENAQEPAQLELRLAAALGNMRVKEAVAEVAAQTGLPRKLVYAAALKLTRTQ